MSLQLAATAVLDFSRRRRRWLLLLIATGASGYGAYKLYHLPSVALRRRKLANLVRTLVSLAEAASSSAEVVSLVSGDLSLFLRSDSDEIPASLKQIAKIVRSEEFAGSVSRVSESLTVGIVRGFSSASSSVGKAASFELESRARSSSFVDRVLDRLLSPDGAGFVSVVVSSFARNLVVAFYSGESGGGGSDCRMMGYGGPDSAEWIRLICDDRCKNLIADCIQRFVSTAVTVYLDRTMAINAYDEIFSGLTNPKNEAKMKDLLVSVCNGAVETLVKTSHKVMTCSNSSKASVSEVEGIRNDEKTVQNETWLTPTSEKKAKDGVGWAERVSSTLAVPSNRKLVLDVTGQVTFETVRSFLEFLLSKLYDAAKRGVSLVREEVLERGLEVVRYVSAKSITIFTICLALCVQLSIGTRLLVPA